MSLSKLSLFSMLASRIFAISRRTWILISVVILMFTILAVWLTISLAGWLFGMAQEGVSAVPDVARSAVQQVEKVVPGQPRPSRICGRSVKRRRLPAMFQEPTRFPWRVFLA